MSAARVAHQAKGIASTFAGPAERGDLRKIERTLSIQMEAVQSKFAERKRGVTAASVVSDQVSYNHAGTELVPGGLVCANLFWCR